jgi:hypothetical protein
MFRNIGVYNYGYRYGELGCNGIQNPAPLYRNSPEGNLAQQIATAGIAKVTAQVAWQRDVRNKDAREAYDSACKILNHLQSLR